MERRQIIAHLYKYHISLDQVPYYCTQCNFLKAEHDKLTAYVKGYSKHVGAAKAFKKIKVTKKKFLRTNPNLAYLTEGVNYIRLSRRESSDTVNSLFDWGKVSFVTSGFNPKIAATAPAPAAELQETALALKSNTFEDLIDEDFSFHNPYLESDAGNSLRFRYSRATGSSGRPAGSCKDNYQR